jgi:hypothetical protein
MPLPDLPDRNGSLAPVIAAEAVPGSGQPDDRVVDEEEQFPGAALHDELRLLAEFSLR